MNVTYVTIGGESRPVKFGFSALTEFGKITGKTLENLNTMGVNKWSMEDLMTLCWCGLKQGARIEGKEFTATLEQMMDWLDDTPGALIELTKEYNKSREVDPAQPRQKKTGTGRNP